MREANGRSVQEEILALDHVNLISPGWPDLRNRRAIGLWQEHALASRGRTELNLHGARFTTTTRTCTKCRRKTATSGWCFRTTRCYPHFQGHGNLSFFFSVHKAPDAEAEERIRATSELMGFGFDATARPQARARSPVGSNSGWPSPAPWCATHAFSSSTNRSRTWMPSCANRHASRSSVCCAAFRSRRSTSPTIRTRPSRWATRSRSCAKAGSSRWAPTAELDAKSRRTSSWPGSWAATR